MSDKGASLRILKILPIFISGVLLTVFFFAHIPFFSKPLLEDGFAFSHHEKRFDFSQAQKIESDSPGVSRDSRVNEIENEEVSSNDSDESSVDGEKKEANPATILDLGTDYAMRPTSNRTAVLALAYKATRKYLFFFIYSQREVWTAEEHDIILFIAKGESKRYSAMAELFHFTLIEIDLESKKEMRGKYGISTDWHIHAKRWSIWKHWVDANWKNYRGIFTSDIDVIFNRNVFDLIPNDQKEYQYFFMEHETHGDPNWEESVARWCFTKGEHSRFSHLYISCAGTTMGTPWAMKKYLELKENSFKDRGGQCNPEKGGCQCLHNLILFNHNLEKRFGIIERQIGNLDGWVLSLTTQPRTPEMTKELLLQWTKTVPVIHQFKYFGPFLRNWVVDRYNYTKWLEMGSPSLPAYGIGKAGAYDELTDPGVYREHLNTECVGEAIETWADGTSATYGTMKGLDQCKAECDRHHDCGGFVHKDLDDSCGYWRKIGTVNQNEMEQHQCYERMKQECYSDKHYMQTQQRMQEQGWEFDRLDGISNVAGYYKCDLRSFHAYATELLTGIVSKRFTYSGKAILTYGNCWNDGKTNVYLDGKLIGSAKPQSVSETIEFDFHSGTLLELKDEEGNAVISITSLEIKCTT